MAKAFTKGQDVFVILPWNRDGVFYIRRGRVHSCGNKEMVIHDETGQKFMGHFFKPVSEQGRFGRVVLASIGQSAAEALALELSVDWINSEIEHFEHRLHYSSTGSSGYLDLMLKDRQRLIHCEPSFIWR